MTRVALAGLALVAGLTLAGCGTADHVAENPGESGTNIAAPAGMPTAVPAATGVVGTSGVATVMDDGSGPELCLGAIETSYPPQCGGPPIVGWSWTKHHDSEHSGTRRWGGYFLTGTWDGTSFTVHTAISSALYDPGPVASPTLPIPTKHYDEAGLLKIQKELLSLPGLLESFPDAEHGLVGVQVVYDDGTLQKWADDAFDANVVMVRSALDDECVDCAPAAGPAG